jgi:tetratricopeptide (TPR) repeat protein
MDALEVLLRTSRQSGMDVEIKRQCSNGELRPTYSNELEALHTKSKIASTAQLLQRLNSESEKLEWALETKREGNALFARRDFAAATAKYVEALTATDLHCDENVQVLALPALCNLCACSLELQQWHKCVLFADQALALRANCQKALYRKAVALFRLGDFDEAIALFGSLSLNPLNTDSQNINTTGITHSDTHIGRCKDSDNHTDLNNDKVTEEKVEEAVVDKDDGSVGSVCLSLSAVESNRARVLLRRALDAKVTERENLRRRKKNLQRAFAATDPVQSLGTVAKTEVGDVVPMTFWEFICFFVQCVLLFVQRLIGRQNSK